jgi:hypothetical protein
MENEDIVNALGDISSNQITEKVDSTEPTDVTPVETIEPKFSAFNLNKVKESLQNENPYVEKKPILDFENIKEFIKSNLNSSDTEEEKQKKYSAFSLNKTKAILEEDKSAGLLDKIDKFDVHNPNLGVFNRDLSYFYVQKLAEKEASDKAANDPNIIKINDRTYIDTRTGQNIYSSVIPKIVENALHGLQKDVYGISSVIAGSVDYAFDTDTLSAVDKIYEKYKFEEPDTLLGHITSTLTEYAIPLKIINRVTAPVRTYLKAQAKANDFVKDLSSVRMAEKGIDYIGSGAAFGIIDFINGNPGRDTVYENLTGEKRLESEEGLSGRELAAARFRNKIRFGQEGAFLGAVGHAVGEGLPVAFKYGLIKPSVGVYNIGSKAANAVVYQPLASLLSKSDTVVPAISNAIRNGSQFMKESLIEAYARGEIKSVSGMPIFIPKYKGEIPPYEQWRLFDVADVSPIKSRLKKLDNFISYFREGFKKPFVAYNITESAYANLKAQSKTITKYLDDLEERSYNLAKSFGEQYKNGTSSQGSREYYLNLVEEFLKNQRKLNSLPKELQVTASALKEHFGNIKKTFVDLLPEGELKDQFSGIIKNYLRKSFAVFTNPEYAPPKDVMETAVKEGVEMIKKYRDMRISAKEQFPNLPITTAIRNYSELMMKNILRTAKADTSDPILTLKNIAKENLILDKSILSGDELPKAIRNLLGEEKNLRSSVLQTTSSFLTQTIHKQLYDDIAKVGLKEGWLKLSKGLNPNMQQIGKVYGLGLMDSNINKLYANSDLALALQGNGMLDSFIKNDWYRGFMQIKAGIQFGKTALSPESQIKNVVTNAGFPISYGWVGGKTSLTDAIKIITGDIYGAGKEFNNPAFIKNIEKLTKLKVLDDNIVVSELSAIIKQLQEGNIKNSNELFKKLSNSKIVEKAGKYYQSGDNIWRVLGYEWNNSFLTKAFKGDLGKLIKQEELITGKKYNPISSITGKTKTFSDAVDELSSWYVRKLMPTYSELPEAIKNLRKLPVGNFISWPAAMLKISGEGIRVGLREASSDMPEIRQLGIRKLIGLFTTYGGAGYVINGLAQKLTGVSDEQIEAYKRSFAPEYSKNSSISPYAPIKNNILKIANFSYGDVYDTIKKPVRAALTQINKKDNDAFVFKAVLEATKELISPYITESLGASQLLDVLPKGVPYGRGGAKQDGTRIYSEGDDWSDQLGKSIVHLFNAAAPGAINTGIKYGNSIYDIYTGRSKPDDLRNKFITTFSGTKVDNIDLQKNLELKVLEMYPKIKTEIFSTEGFYSTKDWQSRGPKVMSKEFDNIQKESFEQQRKLYQIIQDAKTLKISDDIIEEALTKKFGKTFTSNILEGEMTPVKYSKKAFQSRYDTIEREETIISKRKTPNEDFVNPTDQLDDVIDKHDGISLKRNYQDSISKKRIEKEQPGINQIFPKIPLKINTDQQSNIQTPELPKTPTPTVASSNLTGGPLFNKLTPAQKYSSLYPGDILGQLYKDKQS